MPISEQSIVPFGKYKGKNYGELIKDRKYCKWLLKSDWLKGALREFLEDATRCILCSNPEVNLAECPLCES
jgi:hypothetical protein